MFIVGVAYLVFQEHERPQRMTLFPIPFVKMHGLGNDFVIFDLVDVIQSETEHIHYRTSMSSVHVDNEARLHMSRFLHQKLLHTPRDWEFPKAFLQRIGDRNLGIGADQIVFLCDGNVIRQSSASSCESLGVECVNCTDPESLKWYEAHSADSAVSESASNSAPPSIWLAARIFNGRDGTEVGMCANAMRCVALYWSLKQQLLVGAEVPSVTVFLPRSHKRVVCRVHFSDSVGEAMRCTSRPTTVTHLACALGPDDASVSVAVDMGYTVGVAARIPVAEAALCAPLRYFCGSFEMQRDEIVGELRRAAVPFAELIDSTLQAAFIVSVGNPHLVLVFKAAQDTQQEMSDNVVDLVGRALSTWGALFPKGTNVEFVRIESWEAVSRCRMRVFERGAGRTLSCGSGACATGVAVAALLSDAGVRCVRSIVVTDGGEVEVDVAAATAGTHVTLHGAATLVASGTWIPSLSSAAE